jgi:photosystem II cytochrome c550
MLRLLSPFKKLATWLLLVLLVAVSYTAVPVLAASDASMDLADRTVKLTDTETLAFSPTDLNKGRTLFNRACGQCHIAGSTYTNPDVSLSLEDLSAASPARDNVMAMVDYLKNPTTYDGLESLVEFHPNTQLTEAFPKMRNLSDDDLKLISAHALQQANVIPGWGQSKNVAHDTSWGRLAK